MPTISSSDGASNISFVSIFSTIALSPLAPVFSSIVLLAISRLASSVISKSMLSSLKSFVYCLIREFFGSVKILQSASSSSSSRTVITGSLPTSSGTIPNLTRSCGTTLFITLLSSSLLLTFPPKPSDDDSVRFLITLSSPSKAPPQINRMFFVSICMNS